MTDASNSVQVPLPHEPPKKNYMTPMFPGKPFAGLG